ncbi:hypothetical protein MALU111345_08310 [Marinicrinis lubricantis]
MLYIMKPVNEKKRLEQLFFESRFKQLTGCIFTVIIMVKSILNMKMTWIGSSKQSSLTESGIVTLGDSVGSSCLKSPWSRLGEKVQLKPDASVICLKCRFENALFLIGTKVVPRKSSLSSFETRGFFCFFANTLAGMIRVGGT